ncbi:FAD-binding domain-containing protein [Massarina eburnea CBS 473.64]|uniref:FAD-binding domain-containing protein n=1 Tax=Massarina eburnea CBS 473.64 TaxID=1395130 RepID=A0A6A6S0M2_9PLEO|nr:FAD-binding domain-containing protein [Massarina eburnea CBS 473.64]
MEVLVAAGAWAMSPISNYLSTQAGSRLFPRYENSTFESNLFEQLSSSAHVYFPGSEGFNASTTRWSTLDAPNVTITVEVANEADVVEVVKFANEHGKPYLVVNNGHGAITTVGKLQNGVQIWMRQLNSVAIAPDSQTATFGGGILAKDVTDGLWAAGKQTVTGACECVSLLGAGLGGGHGWLQGRHGLVSDQFVSLNMVMADGTLQTIDQNHELWWAMRGAGHNFGIVTSVTSKIYDVEHPNWAFQMLVFTGDKVEGLYTNINEELLRNGTQPVDIMHFSVFINNPALDPVNPVIILFILQEGVDVVDVKYTQSFTALGPILAQAESGDYRDLPRWTAMAKNDDVCKKHGLANTRFPIDIQAYDIPAQKKVFDVFASAIKDTPALNSSLFLFEGYSVQGVKSVPPQDTAYPFRESNLLLAPVVAYKEDGEQLAKKAEALGEELREILHQASGQKELRTYVNYAFGTEGVKSMYGYEQWRQDRLHALKKKYDPQGKFSFYAPIA